MFSSWQRCGSHARAARGAVPQCHRSHLELTASRSGLLIPGRHSQSLALASQGWGQALSWVWLWAEGRVQGWKCCWTVRAWHS